MDGLEGLPPYHRRAAERLLSHRGSVFNAWDSLDLFSAEEALHFMSGSPTYEKLKKEIGDEDEGKLMGTILGFAMVAVEAERLREGG